MNEIALPNGHDESEGGAESDHAPEAPIFAHVDGQFIELEHVSDYSKRTGRKMPFINWLRFKKKLNVPQVKVRGGFYFLKIKG